MLGLNWRSFAPFRILAVSLTLLGLMWLFSPLEYQTRQSAAGLATLIGLFLAFVWGLWLILRKPVEEPSNDWPPAPPNVRLAFLIIAGVALFGMLLRLFDLVVLKQYFSYGSAAEYRILRGVVSEGQEDTGPIAIISAALYPIAVVCGMFALLFRRHLLRWHLWLAVVPLLLFFLYVVLIGARSPFFSAIFMIGLSLVFGAGKKGFRVKFGSAKFYKLVLYPAAAFMLLAAYIVMVFFQRFESLGVGSGLDLMEVSRDVRVKPDVRRVMEDTPTVRPFIEVGAFVTFYFVHGSYYFQELYEYRERSELAYGGAQFYIVPQVAGAVGLVEDVPDPTERVPHEGTFYTFFGNMFMDWGVGGGMIYSILFGMFCGLTYRWAVAGRAAGLLLYPFLASVIFHLPIVDMIAAGAGTFYLAGIVFALLVLYVVAPKQTRRSATVAAVSP